MRTEDREKAYRELARDLKIIANIRLTQERAARQASQVLELQMELDKNPLRFTKNRYLKSQIQSLVRQSDQNEKWVREHLVEYSHIWTKIPDGIWNSYRAFTFFVDDVVQGRARTIDEAIACAKARKEKDSFWYVFGE